jgi:hypothetical protein
MYANSPIFVVLYLSFTFEMGPARYQTKIDMAGVPGPDSLAVSGNWRGGDQSFDRGAHGLAGQLMPLSGGAGRAPQVEGGASSETETRWGQLAPRARRKAT